MRTPARPRCRWCGTILPEPIRRCLTCRRAYCSPVLRDCIWTHDCKEPAVEATAGLEAALGGRR